MTAALATRFGETENARALRRPAAVGSAAWAMTLPRFWGRHTVRAECRSTVAHRSTRVEVVARTAVEADLIFSHHCRIRHFEGVHAHGVTAVSDAYTAHVKRPADSDAVYRANEFMNSLYFLLGPPKHFEAPAYLGVPEGRVPNLDVGVRTCAIPMNAEIDISESPVLDPNAHVFWDECVKLAAHFRERGSVVGEVGQSLPTVEVTAPSEGEGQYEQGRMIASEQLSRRKAAEQLTDQPTQAEGATVGRNGGYADNRMEQERWRLGSACSGGFCGPEQTASGHCFCCPIFPSDEIRRRTQLGAEWRRRTT